MSPRPNVLFVTFDHAAGFATGPGSAGHTPHLDALARDGRRFARAYTTNAICSPARASIMTALYPSAHGMWDCTHTQRREWVDVPVSRCCYFSSAFADAGYRTAYFGKWHVEQSEKLEQFGWQEHQTGALQLAPFSRSTTRRDEVIVKTPGYRDYLLAATVDGPADAHPAFARGIDFLERHAGSDDPFLLFVSALEPHDPYVAPADFVKLHPLDEIELPPTLRDVCDDKPEIVRRLRTVWRDLTDNDWRRVIQCYRALMSYLDHEVGRLITALKRLKLYDNTIIIVTSDHGDMLGGHGLLTKGGGTAYEQVYRIPLVVRVPGTSAGVEDASTHVSLIDLAPTLLDLCGLPPIAGAHGRSLRPVFDDTARPGDWTDAYAEFFGQRFVYTQRIVWHGDWKYIFSPGGRDELYDLATDPHERHNRIDDPACRPVLEDCCRRMWRKMKQIGDDSLLKSEYATLRTAPVGPATI